MFRLKSKKFFSALVMLSIIGMTASTTQADEIHQQDYLEAVYQPVPAKFLKVQERILTWKNESLAQVNKLRSTTDPKVVSWRKAILAIQPENDLDLMQQINKITNRAVTYVSDYDHYKKDYWAPPYETLTEGGDCEDLALLKIAALYMHGWPVQQKSNILVGYVPWQGREVAHAVVEVDVDGQRYILRNFTPDVVKFDHLAGLMKPIYMVNTERLIIFNKLERLSYLFPDEK